MSVRPWPALLGATSLLALHVAAEPVSAAAPRPAPTPRPIRLVANEVVERGWARIKARTADTAHRISVPGGLVGLGSYGPRGGDDRGLEAPPRHLFPMAGVGRSLNADPNTGRSYFDNMP
ncbi:MAG TPA: hypothetical protein VLL75_12140 [Vicinamibacteria bacterium]|nr:hypothetical protein [Vicinamibacteria bacterium]